MIWIWSIGYGNSFQSHRYGTISPGRQKHVYILISFVLQALRDSSDRLDTRSVAAIAPFSSSGCQTHLYALTDGHCFSGVTLELILISAIAFVEYWGLSNLFFLWKWHWSWYRLRAKSLLRSDRVCFADKITGEIRKANTSRGEVSRCMSFVRAYFHRCLYMSKSSVLLTKPLWGGYY